MLFNFPKKGPPDAAAAEILLIAYKSLIPNCTTGLSLSKQKAWFIIILIAAALNEREGERLIEMNEIYNTSLLLYGLTCLFFMFLMI